MTGSSPIGHRRTLGSAAFLIMFALLCDGPVSAQLAPPAIYPTRIITNASAPVTLTTCRLHRAYSYLEGESNSVNRTNTYLTSFTIRWNVYDHSGTMIGQRDQTLDFQSDLAPHDVAHFDQDTYVSVSEPLSAIAGATCRLQSAKFEGKRKWVYGERWSGPISKLPAPSHISFRGSNSAAASAGLSFHVRPTHAWNDTVNGSLYVHVALDVQGGATPANLTPDELGLKMSLANGAQKTYPALTHSAPTYQKLNPLGSTTQTAYEVDPGTDLGRLGSIIVPAHGNVTVIATFLVPDPVANPADNRDVVVK